jgi:Na+/H+ antiporter NhaC
MLVALFISITITGFIYKIQKYATEQMTNDFISGANEIMPTLAILTIAWSLAAVSQDLGLSNLVKQQIGKSFPAWSIPVSLFILSSVVTYFIGEGWGAASLIMPFAIPLAASANAGIPLCVAAVITGGTFGDVTSPVAGMTNMSSNVLQTDHMKYLRYASPYNFSAAGIAAVLFLLAGVFR